MKSKPKPQSKPKAKNKRSAKGQFLKGQPRHPNAGRKKGSKNKIARNTKEALKRAVDELGGKEGEVGFFKEIGRTKPEKLGDWHVSGSVPRAKDPEPGDTGINNHHLIMQPTVPVGCQWMFGWTPTLEVALQFMAWFRARVGPGIAYQLDDVLLYRKQYPQLAAPELPKELTDLLDVVDGNNDDNDDNDTDDTDDTDTDEPAAPPAAAPEPVPEPAPLPWQVPSLACWQPVLLMSLIYILAWMLL